MWSLPDYQPKGHNIPFPGASPHWNCRSVIIPVTKSWEELAKEAGGDTELAKQLDEIPEGERASIGGPVPAGMTYKEWFGEQTKKRQLEILRPELFGKHEQGKLTKELESSRIFTHLDPKDYVTT